MRKTRITPPHQSRKNEHGGNLIADQTFIRLPMLLISKADGVVTTDSTLSWLRKTGRKPLVGAKWYIFETAQSNVFLRTLNSIHATSVKH